MAQNDVTEKILDSFQKVYNQFGSGQKEKIYENAIAQDLRKNGFQVLQRWPIPLYQNGREVGQYYADILVNGNYIVELKTEDQINDSHNRQVLFYLAASQKDFGMVLNFGKEPQFKKIQKPQDRSLMSMNKSI